MDKAIPTSQNTVAPDVKLTLVAFYGHKPKSLADFIRWCQSLLAAHIPTGFNPYSVNQVHATIVALEGVRRGKQILNANFLRLGQARPMDLVGALESVRRAAQLPCRIRIGGFDPGERYPFQSFGQHPYRRSFELQSSNAAVVIGWPEIQGRFPNVLDNLRRELNRYNVLHKYHATEQAIDNDLFFVLGRLENQPTGYVDREEINSTIRSRIAEREPLFINLSTNHLSVVCYVDAELPPARSVRMSLVRDQASIDALTSQSSRTQT